MRTRRTGATLGGVRGVFEHTATAGDLARLLLRLDRGQVASPAHSAHLLGLLQRYCQLEDALGGEDGTKAGQSQAGCADQARTDMPVTTRQVAKRLALVWR